MKVKKMIKLINDERVNAKAVSAKSCDETSQDYCYSGDFAECQVYSFDVCGTKDLAACYSHSQDVCIGEMDVTVCVSYAADYT